MSNRVLQKTNIRIFNKYLIMKTKKVKKNTTYDFYLTEITDPQKWINQNENNLEKIKGKKVTKQIKTLFDEYKIETNVNFHIPDLDGGYHQEGGWSIMGSLIKKDHQEGGWGNGDGKVIERHQEGGGWQKIL